MRPTEIVAKWMGWMLFDDRCPICGWKFADTFSNGCAPGNCAQRPAPLTRADAIPETYSLDVLREVEARLTDEQKVPYAAKIMLACVLRIANTTGRVTDCEPFDLLHASAEEKLIALSQVLGPEVKKS